MKITKFVRNTQIRYSAVHSGPQVANGGSGAQPAVVPADEASAQGLPSAVNSEIQPADEEISVPDSEITSALANMLGTNGTAVSAEKLQQMREERWNAIFIDLLEKNSDSLSRDNVIELLKQLHDILAKGSYSWFEKHIQKKIMPSSDADVDKRFKKQIGTYKPGFFERMWEKFKGACIKFAEFFGYEPKPTPLEAICRSKNGTELIKNIVAFGYGVYPTAWQKRWDSANKLIGRSGVKEERIEKLTQEIEDAYDDVFRIPRDMRFKSIRQRLEDLQAAQIEATRQASAQVRANVAAGEGSAEPERERETGILDAPTAQPVASAPQAGALAAEAGAVATSEEPSEDSKNAV
jgi:hypothetical protein